MERKVDEKLDSLEKYVPFINYLIELDEKKYQKFKDIRHWILSRKRYPMNVLQKIEQSIITQYRNLFFDDGKVPKHIMDIFNTYAHAKCYRVNLCSDDEDNVETLSDNDSDDDVVIISTTPPPSSQGIVQSLSETHIEKFKSKDQQTGKATVQPRLTIVEPICIDSDDDSVELRDTVEISDEKEQKLFKRREDFKHETKEKVEEIVSDVIVSQQKNFNPGCKVTAGEEDNATLGGESVETKLSETNLENMDIDTLKGIYDELTKENGIDVEQLLKSLDVTSMNSGKTNPNNVLHDSNFSSPSRSIYIPTTPVADVNTPAPQSCLCAMQPVLPVLPVPIVPVAPPVLPLIPAQPVKLNLKDPRIVKLLEKNKTLQMISSGANNACGSSSGHLANLEPNNACGGSSGHLPNLEPKTYGEYKRLKEEKARKVREARRAEELKRIEAAKQAEEMKRLEEERRAQELQRIEEASKEEEIKGTSEAKETQELNKIEVTEAAKELKLIEENKKPKELNKSEQVKIVDELKKVEEITTVEALNTVEKINKTEHAKKPDKEIEPNDAQNNITLCNGNPKTAPNQITKNPTSNLVLQQDLGSENAQNKVETRDLRSIILNTILPYGDKILDVLRREPVMHGLNDSIAELSQKEQSGKKVEPISINQSKKLFHRHKSSENPETVDNVPLPNQLEKGEQNPSKSKKKRRKEKEPKTKTSCKRIRTISSSSTSSSISSNSSSGLTTSTSHSRLQSSNSPDPTKHNSRENHLLTAEPMVKLRRLSPETILKYTKIWSETSTPKTINIQLVEDIKRTKKTVHHIVEAKPAKVNLKYKNVDILMTSENTTFCVLCKSKPSNLTNHYRKVHKTESYVARLSSSYLNNLELNVTFANKVTNGAGNIKKYAIKCAFCREYIEDKFINFYKHFSTHTGEYAFQCGFCKWEKPYEFDIQSHKWHSKTCRNAPIRTLYQYPPNVLVIYVYCCKICNFAQLNEANTFKHLRDHHDKRQDDSSYIKKYILAAINDEETSEKASELDTNFELLLKDEDILVKNEAIVEDIQDNDQVKNETDAHTKTIQCSGQQQFEENYISTVVEVPSTSYASYLKQSMLTNAMPAQKNDKYNAVQIKTENQYAKPLQKDTPGSKRLTQNSCKSSYRHYPTGFSYFGLYKCMANDCLYSTDAESEILQHLNEHCNSECPPEGYLLCAYCQLDVEICNTPEMLIEHICKNHKQSQFQCSVCCYRGVSPNYVLEHLKNAHPEQERELVYQCEIDCILDTKMPENLYKMLEANLAPLICPLKDCLKSFLSRTWMKNHLMHAHSLPLNSDYIAALEKYTCIYCTSNFHDTEVAKQHLILCHPDQQPYVCDRNLLPEKEEDLVQNLTVKTVSFPTVSLEKIMQVKVKEEFTLIEKNFGSQNTIDVPESLNADGTTEATNQTESEIKPNVEQLLQIAEENVKYSLLKLIGDTGVTPNLLYHCPHTICGGFFSSYDLWYRHMTSRHCCIISVCPHCPNNKKEELPLVDFKEHFQQHCCHLYGCFHCGETLSSEQHCRDHLTLKHAELNRDGLAIHIEKVTLFFNQPFNVLKLKHENEADDRYGFLLALQEVVKNRCKYVEKQYYESLKVQWTVPFTDLWLERFPSFKNTDSIKRKCFCQNCPFETFDTELFYAHLRANHRINGNKFLCSKCDFCAICESWEPIIDHIKMHVLDIYICTVCSYHHYDRRNFFEHLELNHRCRDVPVVTMLRSPKCIQISIAIVFAQMRKTFSTTRYCFFCNEHSNQWQTYVSHLKNAHHITLQYFCEVCDKSLKLTECDEHFTKDHPTAALRIRAQIATNNQISVDTIIPLKLSLELTDMDRIAGQKQSVIDVYKTKVKQEPCDAYSDIDVEMISEDDIVIANDTKQQESQNRNPLTMVNVQNLQVPNTNANSIQTQSPSLHSQLIPQQVTPPRSYNQLPVPNYAAPRLAIQSYNPNFSGDCNFRPVKILIRTNIGTSPINRNDAIINIQK